jgi:AraC family L-rhamnose operon transcriptional activator RhaR
MPDRISWRRQFRNTENPRLSVQPGTMVGSFGAHDHDFMEIVVIAGGTGMHETPKGVRPLARGDAFVLRPGAWHAYKNCETLRYYNCCFGLDLLRRELGFVREDPLLNYLFSAASLGLGECGIVALRLDEPRTVRCAAHLDAMWQFEQQDPLAEHAARVGHLLLFVSELARALTPAQRKALPVGPSTVHPAVVKAMDNFDDELAREWTLRELAQSLHIDPAYLSRLFTKTLGLPPLTYLRRRRAERAAQLLLRTALPIAEVGSSVGWADPNYFARRFRAHYGITASEYRARFAERGEVAASGG